MRIDQQLKQELGRELCAVIDGWTQVEAADLLHLPQPKVSALRRGRYEGFSVSRLVRLIASRGYNVELHLKPIDRRFALPRKAPVISVVRYNRFGLPITA